MDPLLTAIVIWLSANFDLPASFDHPRIERAPQATMALLHAQSSFAAPSAAPRAEGPEFRPDLVALYDDWTRTIYLLDKWSGRSPAELSVLVHEMVHHLQRKAGTKYECPGGREQLAYEAQDKWLGQFGTSLEAEFGIDGLTLLVRTNCVIGMLGPP